MLTNLFGKRARKSWDAELIWFRLRYLDGAGPTHCLNLLSRPQACGRLALYYQPSKVVSQLYVGVPEPHVRLLLRMAADFSFSLKPPLADFVMPTPSKMTAVSQLLWNQPFVAHIANEHVFVCPIELKDDLDVPKMESVASPLDKRTWHLPSRPTSGLTLEPAWPNQQIPEALIANTEPDSGRWLLGRSQAGLPLQVEGKVNVYGRQEAVADWLVYQVTHMAAIDHSALVVIDGAGDLVPRLKRKAPITRLLGGALSYVDMDGTSLVNGFNPLAAAPGETEAAQLQRWQRWFGSMKVHPQGIQLLAQAHLDGVGDMPGLRRWLKQAERQGQFTAVSSLQMALNRLRVNRTVREWLEWPTNLFAQGTDGALLFACKNSSWERQQLLVAILLGCLPVVGVRLILHGFPGTLLKSWQEQLPTQALISNGPRLVGGTAVLTQSEVGQAHRLGSVFFNEEKQLVENLQLLKQGEGIIVHDTGTALGRW